MRETTTTTLTIAPRYCGPPDSGNGGYSAGLLATALLRRTAPADTGAPVEVTLRRPPPLARPLAVEVDLDARTARLLDAGEVVATARRVDQLVVMVPSPVPVDVASRVQADSPMLRRPEEHPFPTCFVCGPARAPGDGLRLLPARVPGTELFAAPYTPTAEHTAAEFVWAALDCPSSFPMYLDEDPFAGPVVLGRITVRIDATVRAGAPHVVTAWREHVDGRKLHTASAIVDPDGHPLAVARATWIRLLPT